MRHPANSESEVLDAIKRIETRQERVTPRAIWRELGGGSTARYAQIIEQRERIEQRVTAQVSARAAQSIDAALATLRTAVIDELARERAAGQRLDDAEAAAAAAGATAAAAVADRDAALAAAAAARNAADAAAAAAAAAERERDAAQAIAAELRSQCSELTRALTAAAHEPVLHKARREILVMPGKKG